MKKSTRDAIVKQSKKYWFKQSVALEFNCVFGCKWLITIFHVHSPLPLISASLTYDLLEKLPLVFNSAILLIRRERVLCFVVALCAAVLAYFQCCFHFLA